MIEDCKSLALNFRKACFNHVRRNGNVVAHALAKREKFIEKFQIWLEERMMFLLF